MSDVDTIAEKLVAAGIPISEAVELARLRIESLTAPGPADSATAPAEPPADDDDDAGDPRRWTKEKWAGLNRADYAAAIHAINNPPAAA